MCSFEHLLSSSCSLFHWASRRATTMVRVGTRSLISGSSTTRDGSSHQKALIATEVENANGVLLLAMRNLAATMSAVVARLDRIEGVHFDSRNPAGPVALGSLAIRIPESSSSERAEDSSLASSSFSGSTANRVSRFLQHHILRHRPSSILLTPPPATHRFKTVYLRHN